MSKERDDRPWGYYEVLSDEPDHKVKRITVHPGKRLSLQRHHRRAEHWFILGGEAVATVDERDVPLKKGDAVRIPQGGVHRIDNTGATPLTFIEIQTGEYFGEDDIERLEDDYGRG